MVKQKIKIVLPIVFLLLIVGILGVLWKTNLLDKNEKNIETDLQLTSGVSENQKLDKTVTSLSNSSNKKIIAALDMIRDGNYKNSIDNLEKLIEKNSNNNEKLGLSVLLIHSYLNYGTTYYKESDYSKKARKLLESSNIPKNSWYYLFYMGYSYEIERSYQKALEFYNKSLIFASDNKTKAETNNQIGHVYDLEGYIEKAYEFYQKAYKENSSSIQVNLNIGRVLLRKRELKNSIKYFEYALVTTDLFLKAEVNMNLSTIYMYLKGDKIKNFQQSINYAQKAIDINPRYPLSYIGVARVLITLNINLEHAEKLLKEAIKIYPNLSSAYEWLGILEQTKKNYKKSIEYFEKSISMLNEDIHLMRIEIDPKKSKIHYLIAITYALSKDNKNTLKHINMFLDLPNKLPLILFKTETDRENYGIFSILKGNEEFENIIKGKRKK